MVVIVGLWRAGTFLNRHLLAGWEKVASSRYDRGFSVAFETIVLMMGL